MLLSILVSFAVALRKLVALLCTDACFPILIQVGNREGILKKYQTKWTAMKEGITYRSCPFQNLFLYI